MTDETRTEGQDADNPTSATVEEGAEPQTPKLVQTVEMQDIGPCKKHIKVAVARSSLDERLDSKYSKIVPESNVAGFRPGKAPRALVKRRYEKEVTDQVKAEVLLESLEQLAEEHDVAPLAAPNIDPFKIELPKAGPLVYEFDVEVRPQFDLPNYKGLKLKKPTQTFTDEDVAKEENRILSRYGQIVPKPEGNAQIGDFLIVDMTTHFGVEIIGSAKETTLR